MSLIDEDRCDKCAEKRYGQQLTLAGGVLARLCWEHRKAFNQWCRSGDEYHRFEEAEAERDIATFALVAGQIDRVEARNRWENWRAARETLTAEVRHWLSQKGGDSE